MLEGSVTSGIGVLIAFVVIAVLIALAALTALAFYCVKTRGKTVKKIWIMRRVKKKGTKMLM